MNIDKTIQELTNRLNEVHPSSDSFANNDTIRNDGINYWKCKKIISTKDWDELYKKSIRYVDNYKIALVSRKPLLYFPDNYTGSISVSAITDEKVKEEIHKWNKDYYELLEYRKNPILGKQKCRYCLLSGSLDDPIFIGIQKVFGKIMSNQCNNKNNLSNQITYHCNVMNIFSCPFESKEESFKKNEKEEQESQYPYKREDLFTLDRISFAIEQTITTFSEITKNNEIIFEVDFLNNKVHEIHTKYNGERESWGWHQNVKKILSKVKPISNIVIRDEQDIYNILINRDKLDYLIEEYEKQLLLDKESEEELEIEYLKPEAKAKLKEEFKKHTEEQIILLKENKQNIINFITNNKDSIKIEDLKTYEPIYKCYREKGQCLICNNVSNIICNNCCNKDNNKEVWICTNHWQEHVLEHH